MAPATRPIPRAGSPTSFSSILMTSAPRSPRIIPTTGPCWYIVQSRTRIPSSIPAIFLHPLGYLSLTSIRSMSRRLSRATSVLYGYAGTLSTFQLPSVGQNPRPLSSKFLCTSPKVGPHGLRPVGECNSYYSASSSIV